MSRHDHDRLRDMLAAIDAIESHAARGSLDDNLIFDAVRVRLIEIGEAAKDVDSKLLAKESEIPWSQIAKMRDKLTHHYFDLSHEVVKATLENDVPLLKIAILRLLADIEPVE